MESSKLVAIMPGRFQPPHIGHVLTIVGIYPLYNKIYVAVTGDTYEGTKKPVMKACEVKEILERIFAFMPKIEVIYGGKGFRTRDIFYDLPKFDVVLTGNKEVLKNMAINKVRAKYVVRSEGVGWSGTEIRQGIYNNPNLSR